MLKLDSTHGVSMPHSVFHSCLKLITESLKEEKANVYLTVRMHHVLKKSDLL